MFIAVCGFSFFSIWFSVFVKNNGFTVLVSDVVFGLSYTLSHLVSGFSSICAAIDLSNSHDCVEFFYEEGKGGENFRKKDTFRCQVKKEEGAEAKRY